MNHTHGTATPPHAFRFPIFIALALVMPLVVLPSNSATAGTITFSLGDPVLEGSLAKFDVNLEFTGDSGDQIEAIQLSVLGSDPNLLTDLTRFSFQLDSNSPLDSWVKAETLGLSGIELLFPPDPVFGPFIVPGTRQLGVLSVDLTGLPAGTATNVSLNDDDPFALFPTDVGGTFDGSSISSVVSDTSGAATVVLSEPQGVAFNNPIPEPNSLLAFVGLAAMMAGRKRRRPVSHGSE